MTDGNLNLTRYDQIFLAEGRKYYKISLDYIDKNARLLENICIRGISLEKWGSAEISLDDDMLDRLKGQGFIILAWPRAEEGSRLRVKTDPPMDWALIVAHEGDSPFWEALES